MKNTKLKNTIVLKKMASNVVEEAIVILKPNIKIKQKEYSDKTNKVKYKEEYNNDIVKEAENVILEYVDKIQKEQKLVFENKKNKKYRFLRLLNIFLIISNIFILFIK